MTAAFNLNLLVRLNRELGADFDVKAFRHVALYDEALGRVEMHLESLSAQEVNIADERVPFERFERMHTENSYKYSTEEFDALVAGAGFDSFGTWKDKAGYFAVGLYVKRETYLESYALKSNYTTGPRLELERFMMETGHSVSAK